MAIYRGIGGSGDATNDAAVNQIADLTTQAVASAAAALASEIAAAADEVLTNQDTIDTAADLVLTNADVVLTHADVVLTAADAASTAADVLLTNADVVTTNANAATTTQDAIDTAADAAATAADLVQTNLDQIATTADAASTAADALATAADKVATNADVVLTHADVVLTNADAAATALALDEFTDTYLGAKASAPTLDNDGNALIDGALYFDTTINALKVYDLGNTVWVGIANYVHPDHTGDVTSTGDGATVIANNVVTNAKSADVGTSTIKGRIDAGTGDPQDLTPANVRTIINVEDGSTADQTGAEIKVAYEGVANTNAFTDAEQTKLTGIETGATADQTKADIDALNVDADTLDTLDSTQFLRSDADDTTTGHITHLRTNATSITTKANNSTTNKITDLWLTTGTIYNIRPSPLGVPDTAKDFGYDFTNTRWFFDQSPYVGANAVLDAGDLGVTVQGYDVDTAKLDVVQSFTAQQTFKEYAETQYSLTGTVIDPANGTLQYKTLSANTTFTESLVDGQSVTLMINDGTAYTATWPTTTWVGGSAPTLPTTGYAVIELWQINGVLYGLHSGDA